MRPRRRSGPTTDITVTVPIDAALVDRARELIGTVALEAVVGSAVEIALEREVLFELLTEMREIDVLRAANRLMRMELNGKGWTPEHGWPESSRGDGDNPPLAEPELEVGP